MQTRFAFLFFFGTALVSIAAIQGSWDFWNTEQTSLSDDSVGWVSQNFAQTTNKYINKQIIPNHQRASYAYLQLANHFSRADVALPGFAKFFKELSEREAANADYFMSYITRRGGAVVLRDIVRPDTSRWGDGVDALSYSLQLERGLNQDLLTLHRMAATAEDAHLTFVIEDDFLEHKVKLIKQIGGHLAVLEKMRGDNYGLGEYIFDHEL